MSETAQEDAALGLSLGHSVCGHQERTLLAQPLVTSACVPHPPTLLGTSVSFLAPITLTPPSHLRLFALLVPLTLLCFSQQVSLLTECLCLPLVSAPLLPLVPCTHRLCRLHQGGAGPLVFTAVSPAPRTVSGM